MTASTRYERNLPGILDDLSAGPAPEYLDDVFARTGRMRQRPGWTFPERWLPVADIARTRSFAPAPPWRLIVVALLLIALVLAALFVVGSQRKVAPPFGPARNGEIVYDAAGDLFVGNPDTDTSRLLVGGPEVDSAPSYSPDGTRVAFFRNAGCCPQTVDIFAVKADGSGLSKVTTEPINFDVPYANWAPDSRHLAVIGGAAGSGGLELLDVDGREAPLRLAPDMDMDRVAFRPPDGQEIAFRAIVDDKYGVYVMNADGTDIRPLRKPNVPLTMDQHAGNMVYSPDGAQLFYQSYVPAAGDISEGCCQLWVMNADGTDAHPFERNRTAWSGVPSVSPDGQWVSYWYVVGDAPNQVRVAAADGTGPVVATGPTAIGPTMSDFYPWLWAPDSSKILMMPEDGSTTSAYLIDPESGDYTTVPWESGSGLDWQRLSP